MANELSWLNDGYTIDDIPEAWRPRYIIKRVNGEDIHIAWETRNRILEAMNAGARYVQINEITLMVNSINSIDPAWGQKNRPPKPLPGTRVVFDEKSRTAVHYLDEDGQVYADLWEKLFGNKDEVIIDRVGQEKVKQLKEQNKLA